MDPARQCSTHKSLPSSCTVCETTEHSISGPWFPRPAINLLQVCLQNKLN